MLGDGRHALLVEPELFAHVQHNLHVFHDDAIELALIDIPAIPRGLQLTGLDHGEASSQLLTALGFAEGDVVTHVDGTSLASTETIEQLLLDLPTTPSWTVTMQRRNASRCSLVPSRARRRSSASAHGRHCPRTAPASGSR